MIDDPTQGWGRGLGDEPVDPVRQAALALAAAGRLRARCAAYANWSEAGLVTELWRGDYVHPQAALDGLRAILPGTAEVREDVLRRLRDAPVRLERLQAEQRALAGQAPTSGAVARSNGLAVAVERVTDEIAVLDNAVASTAWPSDEAVRRGIAALGRVALQALAGLAGNALADKLDELRRAAGAVLGVIEHYERQRAATEAVAGAPLVAWRWSASEVDLLRKIVSLSAISTEPAPEPEEQAQQ